MNNLERIKQFTPKEKNIGAEIKYLDIMEICQGGPEVGSISINGKKISGIYGISILYQKEYIFIPIYVQKIWGTGGAVSKKWRRLMVEKVNLPQKRRNDFLRRRSA